MIERREILIKEKLGPSSIELFERLLPGLRDRVERVTALNCLAQTSSAGDYIERISIILVLVGRILPTKIFTIHIVGSLDDRYAGNHGLELLAIGDMDLHSTTRVAAVFLEGRLKTTSAKINTG